MASTKFPTENGPWHDKLILAILLAVGVDTGRGFLSDYQERKLDDYRLAKVEELLEKYSNIPPRMSAVETTIDRLDNRILSMEVNRLKGD